MWTHYVVRIVSCVEVVTAIIDENTALQNVTRLALLTALRMAQVTDDCAADCPSENGEDKSYDEATNADESISFNAETPLSFSEMN